MKKLLLNMEFGKYVWVDEKDTSHKPLEILGFQTKKKEYQLHSNIIVAMNGSEFEARHVRFTRGNDINVVFYNEKTNEASETMRLGDFFPNQELIIATMYDRLQFFAPICDTQEELVNFLKEVEENFKSKPSHYPWQMRENFVNLALWLYFNKP